MPKIRLVIFDLCDTIYKVEKDPSIKPKNPINPEYFTLLSENSLIEADGVKNVLFPGVRELFRELKNRGIIISFASLNYPDAWKWFFDEDKYNLNYGGNLIRFPITDSGKDKEGNPILDVKGLWVNDIIEKLNQEFSDIPIKENEVLFVDDLIRNHHSVNKINPDVVCAFPTPNFENGMLSILEILDELENEDEE